MIRAFADAQPNLIYVTSQLKRCITAVAEEFESWFKSTEKRQKWRVVLTQRVTSSIGDAKKGRLNNPNAPWVLKVFAIDGKDTDADVVTGGADTSEKGSKCVGSDKCDDNGKSKGGKSFDSDKRACNEKDMKYVVGNSPDVRQAWRSSSKTGCGKDTYCEHGSSTTCAPSYFKSFG